MQPSTLASPEVAAVDRAAINRSNARRSTGPRSEAGKQRTRLNALRHGLTGHVVLLPSDDLEAYQAFSRRFFDDLKPKGVLEQELVQTLVDSKWRLNRAAALANNLHSLGILEAGNTATTDQPQADTALAAARDFRDQSHAWANLSMYEQRLQRQVDAAMKQLLLLQAERREAEREQMRLASRMLQMHNEKKLSYQPADDGFVFSIEEIETHLRRKERLDDSSRFHFLRNSECLFPYPNPNAARAAAAAPRP